MRGPLALTAFAIVLAASPVWAQQPPAQQPAAPLPATLRQIVPGKTLAGIGVGSRISLVLTRFGRASDVRETTVDMVYQFSRFGITVYAQKGTVTAVSTTNSLMKIGDKVGPGSRVEDVAGALGPGVKEGTVEGFPGLIYDNRGVAFGLDGKAVAVVMVFRPATSGQVSGLLPGRGQTPVAGFPAVAGLRPFSVESNFMSLAGYLRWLVFQASGTWVTYAEATRVVQDQLARR